MTFNVFKTGIEEWARRQYPSNVASVIVTQGKPGEAIVSITRTGSTVAPLEPLCIDYHAANALENAKAAVQRRIPAL